MVRAPFAREMPHNPSCPMRLRTIDLRRVRPLGGAQHGSSAPRRHRSCSRRCGRSSGRDQGCVVRVPAAACASPGSGFTGAIWAGVPSRARQIGSTTYSARCASCYPDTQPRKLYLNRSFSLGRAAPRLSRLRPQRRASASIARQSLELCGGPLPDRLHAVKGDHKWSPFTASVGSSICHSKNWSICKERVVAAEKSEITESECDDPVPRAIVRPQRKLRRQEVAEMVELYQSGKNIYEIAKAFHCHRQTVATRLKGEGLILRANLSDEAFCEQVRALYQRIGTYKGTARHIGIDHATVKKIVRG